MKVYLKRLLAYCLISIMTLSSHAVAEEQTWTVNLKEADIRAFVTQVSTITGYSFIVDPRIKGKVTVISNTPMNQRSVYELFLAVLSVYGFAAIPGDGVIKIVNQNDAKQKAQNPNFTRRTPSEQIVTRVIQVKNASALELVPILRPMVAKYGHLAGVAAANALIISDHMNNIRRIEGIIDELDSPSKYELEVVQLQEAWVGDMVKLLEELAPGELGKAAAAKKGNSKFSVVADQRSNRLILRGDETFREKMRVLIGKLDQPSSTGGKTKVVRLSHADAENMAELLKGLMGDITSEAAKDKGGAANTPDASVYADEGLNALVIRAEPSVLQELEGIIEELDVRRAQVLIEAAIVEISEGEDDDLGIQWALYDQGSNIPGAFTNFSEIGLSAASILANIAANDGEDDPSFSNLGTPTTGITLAAGQESESGVSWGALVQALKGSSNTNVLSTPKVITMDNQESSIIVGDNIPLITGQSTSGSSDTANPFTTIERQDVGVQLKVTPSISEGDLVRLEIEQEISDVSESSAAADIITTKREIKTNVLADNGETIILGGLITDRYRTSESKVPLLGDIPWIGHLFKSTSKTVSKNNLMVFLRPTILRDKESTRGVTQSKFDELWEVNLETKRKEGVTEEELSEMEKPSIESLFKEMTVR